MIKAFVTFALACASMNAQVAIPPSGTSAEPANSVVQCDRKALSTVPTLDAKAGNIWLTSSFANILGRSFSSTRLSKISSEDGSNKTGSFGTRSDSFPQVIFRDQLFAIEDAKYPHNYRSRLASIRAPEMKNSRDSLRNDVFVRDTINTRPNPSYLGAQTVVTVHFHTGTRSQQVISYRRLHFPNGTRAWESIGEGTGNLGS
jgi:hypothetical protein